MLQLNGCSDSGSIGGIGGGSGTDIIVDTLTVSAYDTLSLESYSGARTYFSAGQFQDPIFGDITATGLLKPALPPKLDNVEFADSTEMVLRLAVNKESVYGDTLATSQFEFREIQENWRGPAWRLFNEVDLASGEPVASFSITDEDSIDIPLSDAWTQKYAEYYNRTDSLRNTDYFRNFDGFAVVPQNSGKIITIDPSESRFIVESLDNSADGTQPDSISFSVNDYAYSLDRTNEGDAAGKTKIYNTLERLVAFNFDFSLENITRANISRAVLVFYRDEETYNQSLGEHVVRPDVPDTSAFTLHFVEGDELPQSIDPGSPFSQSIYSTNDNAYHFDVTNLIKQDFFQLADSSLQLYLKMSNHNGVIRSDMLFNDESAEKAPKLIITSTNNR